MCQTGHGEVIVHSPTGVVRPPAAREHAWRDDPAAGLARGTVVVDNLIPGMTDLSDALRRRWPDRYDTPLFFRRVPHSRPVSAAVREDLTGYGPVLLGLGNCGACTTWLAELSAELVVRVPSAVVVTRRFEPVARARLAALGEPVHPVLVVPDAAADADASDDYLDDVAARLADDAALVWSLR